MTNFYLKEIKKELTKAQTKYKAQYESEKKMYAKMLNVDKESKPEIKLKQIKSKNDDESNFTKYLVAGLAIATASIGVAVFAKYKNVF